MQISPTLFSNQFSQARENMQRQLQTAPVQTVKTPIPTSDTVSISSQARELYAQQPPATLPVEPPKNSDKLNAYLEIKGTRAKYQVASDMINIAAGNNQGISPATVYALSKNDQARSATVNMMATTSKPNS